MFKKIKGLLIDIDDTLVKFRSEMEARKNTGSLGNVIISAAGEFCNMPQEIAQRKFTAIEKRIKWWCWSDFLQELNIPEDAFWEYAYKIESRYLIPTEPNLKQKMLALKEMGLQLFITSNNPLSGIKHKLSLAGIPRLDIDYIFEDIYGVAELQNMKWDKQYWNDVVSATQIDIKNLAVVGDNFRDDCEIPASIGIEMMFLIDNQNCYNFNNRNIKKINYIADIVDYFRILKKEQTKDYELTCSL